MKISGVNHHRRKLPAGVATLGTAGLLAFGAGNVVQAAGALEEVIVTAQKREESLQDTPVAVTAMTGNMLERTFAADLRDISGTVPSLVVTNVVNASMTAAVSIRGIGVQEADGFIDPSVGVVVDGVYQGSNTTALLDLFDIERVEILRGPQGTLFGANTIGGVINVISKQPTGEFGGSARLTLGNYGRRDLATSVEIPLTETLTSKVAVVSKSFDGFYEDWESGRDLGGQNVLSARGYLKYTPSDMFDATLQLEYGRGRNDSPVVINKSDPGMALYAPGYSTELGDVSFKSSSQFNNYSDFDIDGATLTMNWDLGGAQLVSITNQREFTLDEWTDQDGSPETLFHTARVTDNEQFSQELRINFEPTDNTNLTTGIYYWSQNWKLDSWSGVDAFGPGLVLLADPDQDDEAWSVFAQGNWSVTDTVRLQAGIRYTWQEKELDVVNDTLASGASLGVVTASGKEDWENLGWRLGVDWNITDNVMYYAYQARGFKSGGFNARITFPEDIGPYDPEIVDTWEMGLKADWLDGTLRTNLAVFYNDYQDLQVDQLVYVGATPVTRVENAASAEISGAELEVVFIPIDGLTLNASLSYLDASYEDFLFDLDANPANGQEDASGLNLRNAPEVQGSLGAAYEFDLGPGYTTFNIVWMHTSERDTDTRNHPVGRIDDLDLLDASVRWTADTDKWSIALRGKNLTDEEYRSSGFFAPGVMNFSANGPRRTVAVELGVNF